jgi:hypothetical protein
MNLNYAAQNNGKLAFSGAAAASPAIDIRHHIGFAFTFDVTADIAADAVFKVQSAPPSDADFCLPGAFVEVPEVLVCSAGWGAAPAADTQITIPAGTKKGSLCTATLPCRPDAFIKVLPVSGDTANVTVVATLHGPR